MALTQVQSGILADSTQTYGMKNRIINGDMRIDQRNAGASVTLSSSAAFPVDRFGAFRDTSAATCTAQQSSTVPNGTYLKSLLWTTTTGAAAGASEDSCIRQYIEGFNFADFGFGTSAAQSFTLSFWVRSSITGTYGVSLANSAATRCYMATYTVNSANTWEQKTITVVGDQSGTWLTDNGIGLRIFWDLGSGTSRSIAASSSWGSSYGTGLTGGVKIAANTGATFYITGVQLEKGSTATAFDYRPYGTELHLCQRYYELTGFGNIAIFESGSTYVMNLVYKVTKRAQPSIGLYTTSNIRIRQFGTSDRDATSPSATSTAGSTNGGYIKVSGFGSVGATSSVAGIGYTTSAENGDLFSISSEL